MNSLGGVMTSILPSSSLIISSAPASNATSITLFSSVPGAKKIRPQCLNKKATDPSKFEQAFDETLRRQDGVASSGINAETLTMIRTRFLLEWDDQYNNQYPYKLFELHRQFLQEGLFDAYNQWLFGSVQNLAAFQNWTNVNGTAYNEFVKYQRGRLFKIPEGQYYHR